jgi:fermentation-respiration switch protein FrsA (DUF1100 family)
MHGDRDRVVPFEQGQRLFAAAPEPKRFFRIAGADHNDTFLTGGEPYRQALAGFVAEAISVKLDGGPLAQQRKEGP